MKFSALLLLVSLCAAAANCARAQESFGTIRSTTKLLPDNSRVTTIKDPEQHTFVEIHADSAGKVQRKTTYFLGDNDQQIGAVFEDGKGKLLYKAAYKQDAQGRTVEASFTGPDDRYLGKRLFIFDRGETARIEDYDANGVLISRPQAVTRPGATPRRR